MLLIIHVSTAILSITYASYTALIPSKSKLQITYLLTFATILSGVLLTITSSLSIGRACASGLVYIGVIIALVTFAKKRLLAISRAD